MKDDAITAVVGVLTAVVGLAIIATLVSNQAQTGNVLAAGAKGFASILTAATGPVTGGSGLSNPLNNIGNLGY